MMKTSTFYKIGFFILLVLNLALISAMLFKKPPPPHPPKDEMKKQLSNQLGFSAQQESAFFKLVDQHHAEMKKTDEDLRKLSRKYFDGLKGAPNSDQFFLLAQISSLETKKIENVYEHFEAIKTLCNEEQLKEFPKILDHALGPILRIPHDGQRRKR